MILRLNSEFYVLLGIDVCEVVYIVLYMVWDDIQCVVMGVFRSVFDGVYILC